MTTITAWILLCISFTHAAQIPLNSFKAKVPVQLGVMSRCPDALHCESVFDQVLERVADKVDLSLTYIAKFNETEPNYGVSCMHGVYECSGNIQQLCVAKYEPYPRWWDFVKCENSQGRYSLGTPESAFDCAERIQLNWNSSTSGQCAGADASGRTPEGIHLLHDSVKATQALAITKSCTIVINAKKVCVHDGTWKECEGGHTVDDFVHQIEEEYEAINSIHSM